MEGQKEGGKREEKGGAAVVKKYSTSLIYNYDDHNPLMATLSVLYS